ncbi:putative gamma-tubulin complex component 5 [Paratrimastix pyriformis]|uniref:Gamma-tubulin complex component 5 n=1 Tax=Paratrimastix pyriformis TaxID=342808 RepID=A0ABQ8U4Y9_9EUKA|nr:putative gamma-tubulin complex component 5 [Paratrimastix pyriformis]
MYRNLQSSPGSIREAPPWMLTEGALLTHLDCVRRYYLMEAGDVTNSICAGLFEKPGVPDSVATASELALERGDPWDDTHSLNALLQEALAASAAPGPVRQQHHRLRLAVAASNRPTAGAAGTDGEVEQEATASVGAAVPLESIDALAQLRLKYDAPFPVDVVLAPRALDVYNRVWGFMLQIRRSRYVLEQLRLPRGVAPSSTLHRLLILRHHLLHFVHMLEMRILTFLVSEIEGAEHLDAILAAHERFLAALIQRAFLHPSAVRRVLGLCLRVRTRFNRSLGPFLEAHGRQVQARNRSRLQQARTQQMEARLMGLPAVSLPPDLQRMVADGTLSDAAEPPADQGEAPETGANQVDIERDLHTLESEFEGCERFFRTVVRSRSARYGGAAPTTSKDTHDLADFLL